MKAKPGTSYRAIPLLCSSRSGSLLFFPSWQETAVILSNVLLQILQVLCVLLLAPLLQGFILKAEERVQRSRGPSIFQPYRDLWKLFHKQSRRAGIRFLDISDCAHHCFHRDDDCADPDPGADGPPVAAVRHGGHVGWRNDPDARLIRHHPRWLGYGKRIWRHWLKPSRDAGHPR